MTQYWDERFMKHLDISKIKTIFEVGARYGDESAQLSSIFNNATIYSFECNPLTIEQCRSKLSKHPNIIFFDYGLGLNNEELPFFSYMHNNDGASSLLKRIDFKETQQQTGIVKIKKLSEFVFENNISEIDLLCMDVQGYELNILKGSEDFIKNIKYVIMEEPKEIINTQYLPEGVHSKYLNSPTSAEIREFMEKNGFIILERLSENGIEDNVLYKNTLRT
jgi:FkbM family methyltransferase